MVEMCINFWGPYEELSLCARIAAFILKKKNLIKLALVKGTGA